MTLINRHQIPIDALDVATLRSYFLDLLEEEFDGELDRNGLTRFGSAQVDFLSLLGSAMFRHAERTAGEGNLASAVESQSVIDLVYARYLYVPRSAQAARHTVQFTKETGPSVTIPAGTQVLTPATATAPRQPFETEEEVVMGASDTTATVAARHGTERTLSEVSTGGAGQIIDLRGSGVDTTKVNVEIGGAEWTAVDTFAGSLPTDRHYQIKAVEFVPGDRRYQVVFGDGTFGRIPAEGVAINVSYPTGCGSAGNVALGSITAFGATITDGGGSAVDLTVTNTAVLTRGLEAEHIDVARVKAPLRLQQHDVVVSLADYEAAAVNVDGGAVRAKAYTRNEISTLQPNVVLLLVAFDLDAVPTTSERDALKGAIEDEYETNGTALLRVGGITFDDIALDVHVVLEQGYEIAASRTVLEAALEDLFGLESTVGRLPRYVVDIGRDIQLSTVVEFLLGFDRVYAVEFPSLDDTEFGVIEVNDFKIPRITATLTLEAFRD